MTVGLSVNDLAVYAFVAVFVAGPWIAKVLKKASQPRQTPPSMPKSPPQARTLPNTGPLAQTRRYRLEELATGRRRAATTQKPPAVASSQPGNLTAAQRVQRARDKAMYEERARMLRQQQLGSAAPPTAAARTPRPGKSAKKPPTPGVIKREPSRRHHTATPRPQPRHLPHVILGETHFEPVERHIRDAPQPSFDRDQKTVGHRLLGAYSLRDAVVLKEILDRPLALRGGAVGVANPDM